MTANVYFRDRNNLITWYSEVDSNGVNLTTFQNLNSGEDVGLDMNFRGRLGKKGGSSPWEATTSTAKFLETSKDKVGSTKGAAMG